MNSSLAASDHTGESIIASHYRKVLIRRFALAGGLFFFIICSLILDFTLGPSGISVSTLWHTLINAAAADAGTRVIVWELRLPFALMAVAVAASAAFLTPIGHKNNTLILGPGGYSFGDYWRMGLPLEILVVAVSIPAILVFWPL